MTEDWQKLGSDVVARLLGEVNPRLAPVSFSPESTTIRLQKLPFYKDHALLELTDLSTVPGARKYVIYKPGAKAPDTYSGREASADVNVINWTNQTIYDTNDKAPIHLNEDTVVSYVKFFFSYVRGRHGRFLIIETIDDVRWQVEPPAQGRKVMQEMLAPVELENKEADTYNLSAFMVFKDSLFKTRIHVKSDGLVSMSDEDLKIEGMPILQDTAA
jgi:hypothetical protein